MKRPLGSDEAGMVRHVGRRATVHRRAFLRNVAIVAGATASNTSGTILAKHISADAETRSGMTMEFRVVEVFGVDHPRQPLYFPESGIDSSKHRMIKDGVEVPFQITHDGAELIVETPPNGVR